jgi:two-component system LytT family response regulator
MPSPIRVLIVDDERSSRRVIRFHVEKQHGFEVIGESVSGREAIAAIQDQMPDLVLLDVQMPDLTGFEVLEAVGQHMPAFIFITAYDDHAVRAFEVHALDYLVKPIQGKRLSKALQRVRTGIDGGSGHLLSANVRALLDSLKKEQNYLDRLVIKQSGRVSFLDVKDIDWIEADDNYVKLHAGEHTHLLLVTMSKLESRLDPQEFLRIHRSIIVNLSRIKEINHLFHGEYNIILKDGTRLNSGRIYRKNLQAIMENSF